jgi:geranylgeranyl diphosphate synthase type II
MYPFSKFSSLIDNELKKINFPNSCDSLYDPIKYIIGLEAKRVRPLLLLFSCKLFKDNIESAISPALGIELFHNFTLLHDDIMDNASLRRGHMTVHKKWNDNTAILSGDAMLVKSYQLITSVEVKYVKDVLNVFNIAAINVCEGQQLDLDYESDTNVTISSYLKMIEYKTAVLLAASLKMGSIIGGASITDQDLLYQFGKNIGIAFQLKDDLLDVFGDSKNFGKEIGGDIMKNKKTYLYLKALELANKDQKKELIERFSSIDVSVEKINAVKSIFEDLNIDKLTSDLVKEYHNKAIQNLNSVDSTKKDNLIHIANQLLDRIN